MARLPPTGSGVFILRRRDRADDWTARSLAVGLAFMKQVRKHVLDTLEVNDATSRFLEPCGRDSPDVASIHSVLELEQRGDFLQAEPEGLRALDEADAVHVAAPVAAIGAQPPARLRHQAAAFVITHGFNAHARGIGDVADGEFAWIRHEHPP